MLKVFPHILAMITTEVNATKRSVDETLMIKDDKELYGDDDVGNRLKSSCHPIKRQEK